MVAKNRILVPVDFSDDSLLALRMADFQAKLWNAALLILYVETPSLDGIVRIPTRGNAVVDCASLINLPESHVQFFQARGIPADTIVGFAKETEVRAIFMGYGSKDGSPGPVATEVKGRLGGSVELFSETMAGLIPG